MRVVPTAHGRAGVVTRVLAAVVDTAVVASATALLYVGTAVAWFAWSPTSFSWPQPTTAVLLTAAGILAFVYLTAAWATTGRTFGAGLLGVRVVSARRGMLGWARAALRALACILFSVGLLWCAVSSKRRSLQDLLLGSIVVYDWHRDGGARVTAAPIARAPDPDVGGQAVHPVEQPDVTERGVGASGPSQPDVLPHRSIEHVRVPSAEPDEAPHAVPGEGHGARTDGTDNGHPVSRFEVDPGDRGGDPGRGARPAGADVP